MRHSIVTIGTFDGVHRGHQYLIKRLINVSRKKKLKSILITFASPVRKVPGVLTLKEEKVRLLRQYNVDKIIVLPNLRKVLRQKAKSFFENYLCRKLNMKHLVVGNNFAFGRNREGNVSWLRNVAKVNGVELSVLNNFRLNGDIVSSSVVRDYVSKGSIDKANRLMGRRYKIEGMPVRGKGLGRKLGFPTVNLKTDRNKLLPNGIFAGYVYNKKNKYPCVVFIGYKSTLKYSGGLVIEAHLLNYQSQWRKQLTTLHLYKKIRDEKKFANVDKLKKQIALDVKKAKNILSSKK
ncbi:MAG: bifunctional riboflavin kinase/FAD synthetase [Endomicrobiales bacterium]|nr:bifunctional riboflavin kinase/FAD synthetase [Endomicrobiales bacterium]